jgi:hypothetical protein
MTKGITSALKGHGGNDTHLTYLDTSAQKIGKRKERNIDLLGDILDRTPLALAYSYYSQAQ